jgi:hypothetical protein
LLPKGFVDVSAHKLHLYAVFDTIPKIDVSGQLPGPKQENEMKLRNALIAAVLFTAGPALAQTPAGGTQQKPATPAPVQPGQPAAKPAGTDSKAPAEKLDPAKEAAIRHLLDVTGESKEGENINTGMTGRVHDVMSRALPADQLPKFMDTFSQRFTAGAPPSAVTDAVVKIYAQHFSLEDIQGITKFYESPVGQRMVKEMPDVVRDSQDAGMQMDQKVVIAVLRGMSDEYPQLKQMLPPDADHPAPAPSAGPAPTPAPGTPTPNSNPSPGAKPTPPQQ